MCDIGGDRALIKINQKKRDIVYGSESNQGHYLSSGDV